MELMVSDPIFTLRPVEKPKIAGLVMDVGA